MKKRIFKNWVTYTLIVLNVLFMCIISGEYNGTIAEEFAYKLPLVLLFFFNHFMIARHSNFFTGEF